MHAMPYYTQLNHTISACYSTGRVFLEQTARSAFFSLRQAPFSQSPRRSPVLSSSRTRSRTAGISCRNRVRRRAAPPAPGRGLFRENVIVLDAGMDGVHDRELIKKKKYPLSLVAIRLLDIARMLAFF